jgi:(p)ppGpp synthase/HD superfamily hydrolase
VPHKLNQPLTSKFDEAFQLASHLHNEQARKGTQIPYISHVLAVAALVLDYGGTETQAIAALLHDTVEDCGGRPILGKIEEQFNREVATIVECCTDSFEEGPKRDWMERKEEHLERMRNCDLSSLIVLAADKLHNLMAMQKDLRKEGAALWSRFNAPPTLLRRYYDSAIHILKERLDNPIIASLEMTYGEVRKQML